MLYSMTSRGPSQPTFFCDFIAKEKVEEHLKGNCKFQSSVKGVWGQREISVVAGKNT